MKRMMSVMILLTILLAACGGNDSTGSTPTVLPTPTEALALQYVTNTPPISAESAPISSPTPAVAALPDQPTAAAPPELTPGLLFPTGAPTANQLTPVGGAVTPGGFPAPPTPVLPGAPTGTPTPPRPGASPTPTATRQPGVLPTATSTGTPTGNEPTPGATPTATRLLPGVIPSVTPAGGGLGDEVRVTAGGYAFRPIRDYELDVFGGGAYLVGPDADPDLGPLMTLTGGAGSAGISDLLADATQDIVDGGGQLSAPNAISVNGVPGQSVSYTWLNQGVNTAGAVAVLSNGSQYVSVLSLAPQPDWIATLSSLHTAVLNSITLFAPPSNAMNVLWRASGSSDNASELQAPAGMDIDEARGRVYVADPNSGGVHVYDLQGNEVGIYNANNPDFAPDDVEVAANGNLYIAERWAQGNKITVMSPAGAVVNTFGPGGMGQGRFGEDSPVALALGSDGAVYALDENEDDQGNFVSSILKFSAEGVYMSAFSIEASDFSFGAGLTVGPDGNLYLTSFWDDLVYKYSPTGTLLATLGEDAIDGGGPTGVAVDGAGNLYVAIIFPAQLLKLSPTGALLGQYGTSIEDGSEPWAEGGFYSPSGVAVTNNAGLIVVADWSGDYAYVTAFTLP